MAERIGKGEFEEKVLGSGQPVLVDFYSDSCVVCKKLSPALAQAETALAGGWRFYKVNTNFEDKLAEEYGILSIPTLIVFQAGEEKGRRTGAQRTGELIEWLGLFSDT